MRGAVDKFARKLEDLAYENSKLKHKVADLKTRIHSDIERRSRSPSPGAYVTAPRVSPGRGASASRVSPPRPLFQLGQSRSYEPPAYISSAPRVQIDLSNTVPSYTDRGPNPKLDRAKERILAAKARSDRLEEGRAGPLSELTWSAFLLFFSLGNAEAAGGRRIGPDALPRHEPCCRQDRELPGAPCDQAAALQAGQPQNSAQEREGSALRSGPS